MVVTIRQVAKRANVSPSTVSKALSGHSRLVNPETRARIKKLAEELGYTPSVSARNLRRMHTETIGLFWSCDIGVSQPTMMEFVRGLSMYISDRSFNLLLCQDLESSMRLGASRGFDGLVIGMRIQPELHEILKSNHIPAVLANAELRDDCDIVAVDNEGGIRNCVDYLHSLGHERIAYINNNGGDLHASVKQRLSGYLHAMDGVGLPCVAGCEQYLPVNIALEQLFKSDHPPTALVCYDDEVAIEVLCCARHMGLSVPDDVSVIGFNNSDLARASHPSLTSMCLPFFEMGKRSAEILFERIEKPNGQVKKIVLPGKLIERASVSPSCNKAG